MRLSSKQNQRISDVAMELSSVASQIEAARPELSALMASLGQGLLDAGYSKELFVLIELPKNVVIVQVGRKVSFSFSS